MVSCTRWCGLSWELLLDIGTGKMQVTEIDEIFENKIRKQAGETVPAQGLFLDEVYYQ